MEDRWVWDLNGEGVFRVKDVRILLDECFLPKAPTATRWVKYVPIKINVFAWKVFLDRLPTRSNLQHRGVLVSDLLCPLCSSAQEDSSHLFFSCRLATDIVRLVCRWWNLSWTPFGSYADWLNWFNSIRLSSKVKDLLEGVLYITWWSVWMFRNQLLFSSKAPRKDVVFDDIVSRSFTWCLSRCDSEPHSHAHASVLPARDFLSQKGSGGGRGVKEKNKDAAAKDVVSPSVIVEPLVKEKKALNFRTLFTLRGNGVDVVVPRESIRAISERFANTAYGFFLGKQVAYPVVANYVRNTWGKYDLVKSMLNSSTGLFSFQFSSMDGLNAMLENDPWFIRNHPLILKKWNPNVNLLKEDVGNVSDCVKLHGVPVTAFSEDGLSVISTKLSTPLMLDSYTSDMCLQSWGRSSYARAMIELRADVELKDTTVVAMPKLPGEGFYTCTEECSKNPNLGVAKSLKKPSEAHRGVPVGTKVGFKPAKEYRHVSKKPTANTSSNKKKGVKPTKELGTNGGTSNLASNGANSSGSSFWNVETSSTSTTPIINKIEKLKKLIIDEKVTLVDDDGKSLKKVDYPSDHDSEDVVESVDNDMARSIASERVGFGNKSLLEQWRGSYENGDYVEDPYDDDMYEGQDIPHKIQDICDNLDIRVQGRRKK
ncbi:retrotransposon protein, putative, ty1-copia subclass [Tanacetum coccineum]